MLRVISLGWGVQSFTLAAMSALGELDKVDFAIHADTTWERTATYEFAVRWTPWLEGRGVQVATVSDPGQARKVYTDKTDIPAFTLSEEDGVRGQLRRQCTGRWKITPMRKFISAIIERSNDWYEAAATDEAGNIVVSGPSLKYTMAGGSRLVDELTWKLRDRGVHSLRKTEGVVEQWLGISQDEWHRAKDSDVQYIAHRYPLLDLGMTRRDCVTWLERNGLEVPPKSRCKFCPYLNRAGWQEMKRNEPEDWKVAVGVDLQIRDVRPPYPLFVHSSRLPLEEAVDIPEDHGMTQPGLFDQECDSGHCFL